MMPCVLTAAASAVMPMVLLTTWTPKSCMETQSENMAAVGVKNMG